MSKSKPNQQFSDAAQGSVQVCGSVFEVPAEEFKVLQMSAAPEYVVKTSLKQPTVGQIYLSNGRDYVDLSPTQQLG